MSTQPSFSQEEWTTLVFSPLWAFSAVATADEKIDQKEVEALSNLTTSPGAAKDHLAQEVLFAIGRDASNVLNAYKADPRSWAKGLSEAADVLDQRVTPDAAQSFKISIIAIARYIAEASGGTLGMGSKVSDKEKAAVVLVAAALRLKVA